MVAIRFCVMMFVLVSVQQVQGMDQAHGAEQPTPIVEEPMDLASQLEKMVLHQKSEAPSSPVKNVYKMRKDLALQKTICKPRSARNLFGSAAASISSKPKSARNLFGSK